MECEAERRPLGVFKCQLCALTAPYSYVGQKPPDTQSIILLEESYVMKDPFTSDKGRFLVLGSQCSLCSRLVCVGPVGPSRGRNCAFWSILEHSCAWGLFYQCTCLQSGPKPNQAKPYYTHLIDEETEECSLFYSKRFCLPCIRENIDAFPQEIRQDLEKKKGPSKRPASQPGSQT